jgi:hypothetical protein
MADLVLNISYDEPPPRKSSVKKPPTECVYVLLRLAPTDIATGNRMFWESENSPKVD